MEINHFHYQIEIRHLKPKQGSITYQSGLITKFTMFIFNNQVVELQDESIFRE